MVQLLRQAVAPADVSHIVQHHRPLVAIHPLLRGAFCPKGKPFGGLHHGIRDLAGRVLPLRQAAALLPTQPAQHCNTGKQQQQNNAHRRQHIPPDQAHKGFHASSPFVSL